MVAGGQLTSTDWNFKGPVLSINARDAKIEEQSVNNQPWDWIL